MLVQERERQSCQDVLLPSDPTRTCSAIVLRMLCQLGLMAPVACMQAPTTTVEGGNWSCRWSACTHLLVSIAAW
jgi:hypothetical protein